MKKQGVPPNQSEWLDSKCETEVRLLKGLLKKVSGLAVELEEEIDSARCEIRHLRGDLRRQRIALDDLYASRSWKMTQPIRAVSGLVKSMFYFLFPSRRSADKRDKIPGGRPGLPGDLQSGQHAGIPKNAVPNGREPLSRNTACVEDLPRGYQGPEQVSLSPAGSASPGYQPKQLLVDISTIFFRDIKTGIQRVIRAQLMELITNPPEGFSTVPVYLDRSGDRYLYRHADAYLGELFGIGKLNLPATAVSIYEGDILYMPDYNSYLVFMAAEDGLFRRLKAEGVVISATVYDLLPILRPEFFNRDTAVYYEKWIRALVGFANQVICISEAVAAEMSAWIKKEEPQKLENLIISSLHLGADIEASAPSIGKSGREEFNPESPPQGVTFLMVGTIEPRKGHLQALSAFDLLRKEGEDVNLLIVGREGWLGVPREEKKGILAIVRKIRSNPELHRSLFWMDDADDSMLVRAYDSSSCLIFASEGEGFGLPLIEAARHGLPIIARDIPVFREVAGEHAFYFTGLQAEDLAGAMRDWLELFRGGEHPPSRGIPWMTWKENVEQLKRLLIQESRFKSQE